MHQTSETIVEVTNPPSSYATPASDVPVVEKIAPPKPARLLSLDAFRGAIMIFLLSAGFGLKELARSFLKDVPPGEPSIWRAIAYNTDHVAWVGGGAWDMIQPAFMFMVGVAMPFSYGRRRQEGQAFGRQFLHALWRAAVLILISLVISTKLSANQTTFIFPNVLAQIGLGYVFVFLLVGRGWKVQWGAIALIAIGYWLFFALHPLPAADFKYTDVGVKKSLVTDVTLPGFFAHWNMNANAAAEFDRWFLNLFPTEQPFKFNTGGYQTLNFVPSMITMILGLVAGERLRRTGGNGGKLLWLAIVATACLAVGLVAGYTVCPIVKRIWTPSWAFYSGGIVLFVLAFFYLTVEVAGWRRWTFPLVVVGANSIAAYLFDIFVRGWVDDEVRVHFGRFMRDWRYEPVVVHTATLLLCWLVLWWMYRRKLFLKI